MFKILGAIFILMLAIIVAGFANGLLSTVVPQLLADASRKNQVFGAAEQVFAPLAKGAAPIVAGLILVLGLFHSIRALWPSRRPPSSSV